MKVNNLPMLFTICSSLSSRIIDCPVVDKPVNGLWITIVSEKCSIGVPLAASLREPLLQHLLRASGEAVAAVDRATVGQVRPRITIEALHRRCPGFAARNCGIWLRSQILWNSVPIAFGSRGTYHDLVGYSRRAFIIAKGYKERHTFGCRRLLRLPQRVVGRVARRRTQRY